MTVTPDAIRGSTNQRLSIPRMASGVSLATINRRTREKTLDYIKRNAEGLGILIISSDNNCQGFKIETHGDTHRRDTELSGLWLVAEKWSEQETAAS